MYINICDSNINENLEGQHGRLNIKWVQTRDGKRRFSDGSLSSCLYPLFKSSSKIVINLFIFILNLFYYGHNKMDVRKKSMALSSLTLTQILNEGFSYYIIIIIYLST